MIVRYLITFLIEANDCLLILYHMIAGKRAFRRESTRKSISAVDRFVVFHSGFPFGHLLHGLQDDFAEYCIGTLHNGYVVNGTIGFNNKPT